MIRDTSLGTIKLKDISEIIMGQSPKGSSYNHLGSGLPLLNGAADYKGQNFHPQKYTNAPTRVALPGDILMGVRATIGNFALADNEYCIGRGVAAIRVQEKLADSRYVLLIIKQQLDELMKSSAGSTIKGIRKEDLTDMEIMLPSLSVQREIVKTLDKAYEIIKNRQEAISELDNLIQSVFLDMFGDPVANSKNLPVKQIDMIGEIQTGNTPPRKVASYYGDYVEWIKSDNLNNDNYYLTTATEFLSKEGAEKGRVVPSGSVLVTCIAGSLDCIGNAGIADREVAFNQQINSITPDERLITTEFLFSHILFGKRLFRDASNNSMKGMLNKTNFSRINLIVPPLEEQKRYSEIFRKVYTQKRKMEEQLELLNDNFQGILSTL